MMGELRRTQSPGGVDLAQGAEGGWHRVTAEQGYIRAELFNRETLEETQQFLDDTVAAARKHRCAHILIIINNSKTLFAVERYGFSNYLEVALKSEYKIALVGSNRELRIAHEYYAMLAQQRGVNLHAFPDEADAIAWLTSPEPSSASEHA